MLPASLRLKPSAVEAFSKAASRAFSMAHGNTVLLDVIHDLEALGLPAAAAKVVGFLRTSLAVAGRGAPVVEHASLAAHLRAVRAQSRREKFARLREVGVGA